jgi:phosphoenolpyruvate phosphomutase
MDTATLISNSRRSYESDSNIASVKEIFSAVGYDKIIERDKEKSPNISALIACAGDHKIGNLNRSLNNISGKPLIKHQIETFRRSGIENLTITVNNFNEFNSILEKNINIIETDNNSSNQLLDSIMTGLENINGPVIFTYGDILFNDKIISELVSSENDIVIAADSSYKYHKHDVDKKLELLSYKNPDNNLSRRKLKMTDTFEVKKVSKNLNLEEAQSEFFGLAFFSKKGIINLKSTYEEIKDDSKYNLFIDLLNYMMKKEFKVFCNEFDGGWIELHTENDFELAEKELEN